MELDPDPDHRLANRLTYFSEAINGAFTVQTVQSRLEGAVRRGKSRQATRYSVHGLHEYKGKFNPQVVRGTIEYLQRRSWPKGTRPLLWERYDIGGCVRTSVPRLMVSI